MVFTVFTGLPAILRGVRGLAEIHRNPKHLAGRALAWGGIGTGVLGVAWGAFLLMLAVEYVQDSADRMH